MALNNGDGSGRPSLGPPGLGAPGSGAPGSGAPGSGAPGASGGRLFQWKGKSTNAPAGADPDAEAGAGVEAAPGASGAEVALDAKMERMEAMFEELGEVHTLLVKLSERDTHNEKAFNTLHAELGDYKKDFIYEHLKPVVRPLLFLFDSIEGFEAEIAAHEAHDAGASAPASAAAAVAVASGESMPTRIVRQNTVFFREQLVEALRICEVTPMDTPQGRPDLKHHKAIRVVAVGPEQDGLIQSVVRSGWFLNGHLLRPAEVVVGKHRG